MRTHIKSAAKAAVGWCGKLSPRLRSSINAGLTVFVFHEVSDTPSMFHSRFGLAVSRDLFRRQIEWISRNFQVVHASALENSDALPSRAALLTFDDGFHGIFYNALPILDRLNLPSVVFMNMGHVRGGSPLLSAHVSLLEQKSPDFVSFCRARRLSSPLYLSVGPSVMESYHAAHDGLTYSEIEAYAGSMVDVAALHRWSASPRVTLGNHLYRHWNYNALTESEFCLEIQNNAKELAAFGHDGKLFAYTNGLHPALDADHERLLRRLGITRAFTTACGVNRDRNAFFAGRVPIGFEETSESRMWFRLSQAYC